MTKTEIATGVTVYTQTEEEREAEITERLNNRSTSVSPEQARLLRKRQARLRVASVR